MPRYLATISRNPTANVAATVANGSVRATLGRNPTANVEATLEMEDI